MEEETKECPSCHLVNPVTRVTCQGCHTKLLGKNEAPNPFVSKKPESAPSETAQFPEKKKRGRKPKIVEEIKPRKGRTPKNHSEVEIAPDTYVSVSKSPTKEVIPEKSARKKRQRKPKSLPIQYFALAGNTLLPISISIQMKPMRKKAIENVGQKLMSLWNRNKSFIS